MINFTIEDNCYINDKFIGTTVAKKITVNLINENNEIDLENKEIQPYVGINNEYVPFGNFIIQKPNNEEVKEKTNFVGYDYMIKFNIPYEDRVLYPIEASALFEDICNQVGLVAGNLDFTNSDYMILGNPFTNNEDCRTVLSAIAQLSGGFAHIGRDNKVYIVTLEHFDESQYNVVESIDGNNYFEDFSKNDKWGEVNSVVLKLSGMEGEETKIQDAESILINGLTEIVIEDNPFLISETEREEVIGPLWNNLKGLEYFPYKVRYYGFPYLDVGDLIEISDSKDEPYYTYVFNHTFTYNGTFGGNLETKALTKTQTAYKNTMDIKTKFKQTERKIDKINGIIEDVIEEQDEYEYKLTKVEQDVEKIEQDVENFVDFTREKTQMENLYLDDIAEGEGYLLDFIIYGNTNHFTEREITICASENHRGFVESYLLTESEEEVLTEDEQNLIMRYESHYIADRQIILDDVLRNLNVAGESYYDTLEILQDGTIQVTRRIGVDDFGELYLLENEEITILEQKFVLPSIKEGTYYFVKECPNLNYYAKYIIENDYSDTFLTKLELGTKLIQNAEYIRVAWNQISQYLQMEGLEGRATLNIYDADNKILMSLSQDGQTFYNSYGEKIGTVGIVREQDKDTLAFAMNVDWDNITESKSMAWGYFTKDGTFLPIFHLVGTYGAEGSEYGGKLAVEGALSVDEELNIVKGGVTFTDGQTDSILDGHNGNLRYTSDGNLKFYISDNMLMLGDSITGYRNNQGEMVFTAPLAFFDNIPNADNISILGGAGGSYGYIHANFKDGSYVTIYADNSDKRLKENIEKSKERALEKISKINHYEFDWKENGNHQDIGYIAQEMEKVDKSYVHRTRFKKEDGIEEESWQINTLGVLATATKAIQEQQEEIKQLKEKDKQKDEIIQDLLKRIEKLEEEK